LGSGTILREVLAAADLLQEKFSIPADVWSVTSFSELRRDGMAVARWNRLHPQAERRQSYIEQCLASTRGPIVAASDYVSAVADLIRPWVPRRYVALGTDGFGRSDTRAALRRYFEIDRQHIVIAALDALASDGVLDRKRVTEALARYGLEPPADHPWAG
jgi:pyruvate dehydrogenase E1 component